MSAASILTALAAGLISAVLVLYPVGGLMLAFAHAPLFAAGLTSGTKAAALAGATATAVWVVFLSSRGLLLGVLFAVPAWLLVRQAMQRAAGKDDGAWCPADRLLSTAVACALVAAAAFWFMMSELFGDPRAEQAVIDEMTEALRRFGGTAVAREDVATTVAFTLLLMPGVLGAMFLYMLVVNAAIVQSLATRLGRALRPAPRMADLAVPSWMHALFAIGLFGMVLPGLAVAIGAEPPTMAPRIGAAIVLVLFAAFVLGGLAILHTWAERWANRRGGLITIYLGIFVVGPLLLAGTPVLMLFFAGLLEPWARLRERIRGQAQ
jgi:Predicted membrane protein (DUF2232)